VKLDARRIEAFLRDPGTMRAALLYGDDVGLIRERGGRLVRTVAGAVDDPFKVTELERDAAGRMAVELASPPLTGGRRVVRVREVGDAAVAAVQAALEVGGPGFLILEAPGLASRSKLRALIERAAEAAAIGCYPAEGAALGEVVVQTLRELGVSADLDALRWLESRLGGDMAVTRSEVAKLALYAGGNGRVDMEAAQACVGDLAGLSVEDALFAATAGDVASADRSLEIALGEGAAPVAVLRAALGHLQRLHRARLAIADGASVAEAARGARPPVFFRREPAFQRALGAWSAAGLEAAATRVSDAERACKRTGAPAETICRSAVIGLAQRSAMSLRRA
jgi:DNA polymerase III subunit delta